MTTSTGIAADLAPTGALRASINLGNPVLAHGTPEHPSGVTVALAREIGARLDLPVEMVCFDAARKSFEAMTDGKADICFLAIDPAREAERGSAYDLYLTRTLQHATVVRGEEGVDVFLDEGLDAAAGIRQPMTVFVDGRPDMRLIDERFMQIQQAVGTMKGRHPDTVAFLRAAVEDLKASGFVSEALRMSGQADAVVAPPG